MGLMTATQHLDNVRASHASMIYLFTAYGTQDNVDLPWTLVTDHAPLLLQVYAPYALVKVLQDALQCYSTFMLW